MGPNKTWVSVYNDEASHLSVYLTRVKQCVALFEVHDSGKLYSGYSWYFEPPVSSADIQTARGFHYDDETGIVTRALDKECFGAAFMLNEALHLALCDNHDDAAHLLEAFHLNAMRNSGEPFHVRILDGGKIVYPLKCPCCDLAGRLVQQRCVVLHHTGMKGNGEYFYQEPAHLDPDNGYRFYRDYLQSHGHSLIDDDAVCYFDPFKNIFRLLVSSMVHPGVFITLHYGTKEEMIESLLTVFQ